jgi:hypothetical protein
MSFAGSCWQYCFVAAPRIILPAPGSMPRHFRSTPDAMTTGTGPAAKEGEAIATASKAKSTEISWRTSLRIANTSSES